MSLYVVHTNEDGEASIQRIDDFPKWVEHNPGARFVDYPQRGYIDLNSGELAGENLSAVGSTYLLIKGEVVVPRPKEIVTSYEEP